MSFTPAEQDAANDLSRRIIGAAIEVHRNLGPGLMEGAYEECLCRELEILNVPFRRRYPVDIDYKGILVRDAYRIDVLVAGTAAVRIKAVEHIHPIFEAELLTQLRLKNLWLGLLINFNVAVLKDGIRRRVLG